MKPVLALVIALLLSGCVHNAATPLASTPAVPLQLKELLLVDMREEHAAKSETMIRWKPRSPHCVISLVAKSLGKDEPLKVDIMDARGQNVNTIQLSKRADGWLSGNAILSGSGEEVHFRLPHANAGEVTSTMIEEDLTPNQRQDVVNHGVGSCVDFQTSSAAPGSPMVRAPGQKVTLRWDRDADTKTSAEIDLIGDAKTLAKSSGKQLSGSLDTTNSGSIQVGLHAKPGQLYRFTLSFH